MVLQISIIFSQNTFVFGNDSKIYAYDTSLTQYSEIYRYKPNYFLSTNSSSKLLAHPNGKLYGITNNLSQQSLGYGQSCLFNFDLGTKQTKVIARVGYGTAIPQPNGYLTLGANNLIYGASATGGSFIDRGAIFCLNPQTNAYTKLVNFTSDNDILVQPAGLEYYDSLIIISYVYGGPKNAGGCELISPLTGIIKKRIFYGSEGNSAGYYTGGLLLHENGWLYGVNKNPINEEHMFMRVNPITGYAENLVKRSGYTYIGPNLPYQKLIQASNGDMFGSDRDGKLFSFDVNNDSAIIKSYSYFYNNSWDNNFVIDRPIEHNGAMYHLGSPTYIPYAMKHTVATNSNVTLSYNPVNYAPAHSSLTKVGAEIYFAAKNGGSNGDGLISKYDTVASQMVIVYSFNYATGSLPEVVRTLSTGEIIGITNNGGNKNAGVIFKYNVQSAQYTVVYHLDSLVEGKNPIKEILELGNGKIMFATTKGAGNNRGSLVVADISNSTCSVIKTFDTNNTLGHPDGEMLYVNGKFFGTASLGGIFDRGGIFEYDATTNRIKDAAVTENYQFVTSPTKGIALLNNKIYGLVDTINVSNLMYIYEFDPISNNFGIKKALSSASVSTNQIMIPLLPLTVLGNRLVSAATYNNNTIIFSYDPASNNITVDYTFPSGFFNNRSLSAPPVMMDNTYALLSFRSSINGTMGEQWKYDYINHTMTQVSTMTDCNYLDRYNSTGTPIKVGNKYYGLTSLGYYSWGSGYQYHNVGCYFYSYDDSVTNFTIENKQGDINMTNGIEGKIFKFNQSIYSFLYTDSLINTIALRKFNNDRSYQDFYFAKPDSSSIIDWLYQYQDSLVYYTYYNDKGGRQQWIYKLNLNSMVQTMIYLQNTNDGYVNELYRVNTETFFFTQNSITGNAELYQLLNGNLVLIDANANAEIKSLFTDGSNYLYSLNTNTVNANYSLIYKYDVQNNSSKSLLMDLMNDTNAGLYNQVTWCRKLNGKIIGNCNNPNASGGVGSIIFNIDDATNIFKVDSFYINGPLQNYSSIKNIDRNILMCNNFYHNLVTHYTKSFNNYGNGSFVSNVLLLNDSSKVDISSAMQSSCLSSKQILVANSQATISTYKWFKNDIEIVNAINDSLIIENFTPSDSGFYYCYIGTNWGEAKSNIIHLDFEYCNPVYPGDANSDGIVNGADIVQIGLGYGSVGLTRLSVSNVYNAFNSNDWISFAPNNLNNKHADCNGDGAVNFSDTVAVNLNYLQAHPLQIKLTTPNNEQEMRLPPVDIKMVASQNNYLPGSSGYIDIVIGNASKPVRNIYGLYYSIEYNDQVVNNITIDPRLSWVPSISSVKLAAGFVNNTTHLIDGGLARYDHTDTIGFGTTARIYFNTTNTVFTSIQTAFTLKKIALLNSHALKLPLLVDSLVQFNFSTVTNVDSNGNNSLKIWMYDDIFRVHSKELINGIIEIYDLQGKLIAKQNMNSFDEMINLNKEANGMYIAKLNLIDGTSYKKKIIKQ